MPEATESPLTTAALDELSDVLKLSAIFRAADLDPARMRKLFSTRPRELRESEREKLEPVLRDVRDHLSQALPDE